ncbi:MAG: cytochrome c maturation protein CcmE [Rhodospirillales bacterium]|nr:cytochrome c maturation protein CcmE [Rhodospirillales bacterium]
MKRKHRRFVFVATGLAILFVAAALILSAMKESLVFFHSPTELAEKPELADKRLRIGGLVETGSVERGADAEVRFRVTDLENAVPVRFKGLLPDLFREGQGVVVEGHLQDGVFMADEVLAKHDENYMPPEVADALKKSGKWEHMKKTFERSGEQSGEQSQDSKY